MSNHSVHIHCIDEGYGPLVPVPCELEGATALMVNPLASQSVLLDAANARASRIIDVTRIFIDLDLEGESVDFPRADACRLLTTVNAMAYAVCHLLVAAQEAELRKIKGAKK